MTLDSNLIYQFCFFVLFCAGGKPFSELDVLLDTTVAMFLMADMFPVFLKLQIIFIGASWAEVWRLFSGALLILIADQFMTAMAKAASDRMRRLEWARLIPTSLCRFCGVTL
jgi:hypothetical protein